MLLIPVQVKENRESKIAKTKAYWEWRDDKGNLKAHDPRGTASFVASKYYTLPVDPKFCKVSTSPIHPLGICF